MSLTCQPESAAPTETGDEPLPDVEAAPGRSRGASSQLVPNSCVSLTGDELGPSTEAEPVLAAGSTRPLEADEIHLLTPDGQPWHPPADYFADPGLPEYTRVTVTADGRVYGHVADWRAAHISYQGRNVRPPRSHTGYAWFHRRAVRTDGGDLVRVGQLTFGPGHASPHGSLQAAVQHYDATCAQGAVVHAGEDEHGIWVAGAVIPTLTPPERNQLALADLSGDWRHDGRGLEMVAAHCVGTPGFLSSRDASGQMMAMAADAHPETGSAVHVDDSGTVITLIAASPSTQLAQGIEVGDEGEAVGEHSGPAHGHETSVTPTDTSTDTAASDGTATGTDSAAEADGAAVSEQSSVVHDGTQHRALAARRRMAIARHHRVRRATAQATTEDACPTTTEDLDHDIDAIVASLDPTDPDTKWARVLAAAIRHGGNGGDGSLVAASAASLDRKPGSNWVEDDPKGLPRLVRRVARHIERRGRPLSIAIPAAINWVKHVCRTGDVENFPGLQRVNPVSRAAACRAVAEWNALKARH